MTPELAHRKDVEIMMRQALVMAFPRQQAVEAIASYLRARSVVDCAGRKSLIDLYRPITCSGCGKFLARDLPQGKSR